MQSSIKLIKDRSNTSSYIPTIEDDHYIETVPKQPKHFRTDTRLEIQSPVSKSDIAAAQTEDILVTSRAFALLKMYEAICCSLAVIGFGCGAIGYDLNYKQYDWNQNQERVHDILMVLSSVSTLLLLIAISRRTFVQLRWEQSKGIYSWQDNLFTTNKLNGLIIELALNCIHSVYGIGNRTLPYHNIRHNIEIYYTYNEIFTIISVVRVYHIVRLLSILSIFRATRAQRLCQINGTYAGTFFAVKAMMKEQQLYLLSYMLLGGVLVGGFCLRIFERRLSQETYMDFSGYSNSFWCTVVTMTTVGFGDYYPVTLPGRVTVFFICIWGVFTVSLSIVSLANLLVLEPGEEKSYIIMKRLKFRDNMRELAGSVLTAAVRYRHLIRHYPKEKKTHAIQLGRFRNYINEFHKLRIQMRIVYDFDSFEDCIERSISYVIEDERKNMSLLDEIDELIHSIQSKINN
jgi:hypothetical protein